ncbi:MAG TPA: hypothetical protein VEC37_14640 [Bacillota bacterium]|nr:hypothetical protein [Bacillota bacterium]
MKYFFKMLLDFLVYIFMGFSMFSLVVFPFIIKSIDYVPLSNCLTLWSLALIFMATVVKEIKYNLASRKKSDKPNSEFEQNPTGREVKLGA